MEKSAPVRCKRIMVNLWMTVIFVTMAVLLSACSAKRPQGDVTDYSDEETGHTSESERKKLLTLFFILTG